MNFKVRPASEAGLASGIAPMIPAHSAPAGATPIAEALIAGFAAIAPVVPHIMPCTCRG